AGVRVMTISEIFVKEVQLVTNAFAPEFGNTPGLIMNVVTPSGTNELDGTATYRFRRPSFYSRPFSYTSPERLTDNRVSDLAITLGLPIKKDHSFIYGGYEQFLKDDKTQPNRLLTISEATKTQLITAGLPASIFPAAIPSIERGYFLIFRTDLQLNPNNRLSLR